MIRLKKIEGLKERTKLRKCGSLMYEEGRLHNLDDDYISGLSSIAASSLLLEEGERKELEKLFSLYLSSHDPLVAKDIYYLILRVLGEEVADWDFRDESGALDSSRRSVKKHSLFLDRIRSPYNIGAIFRSAEAFEVDHIYLYQCGDVKSPRCERSARGTVSAISYTLVDDLEVLKKGRAVFALELGGESLSSFDFPSDAICVLGSEEDGVSPEVLSLCDGRVSIEQFGSKGSLNVSVAAGILLHSWAMA